MFRRLAPIRAPLLVLGLALPFASGAAAATTWYVAPGGRDWQAGTSPDTAFATLQRGANAAQAGDTILVADGTYATPCAGCNVVQFTTDGAPGAPITMIAAPGAHPIIDSSNAWNGIRVSASWIVLDGFEIRGGRALVDLAYAKANAKNLGNYRTSGNGVSIGCDPGTNPTRHHVTVRNMNVHDEPGGGISACYSDYITFTGNVSMRNAFWSPYGNSGFSIYDSRDIDTNTGVKNIIDGNVAAFNREYIPFYLVGKITDGNGIIVDDNRNTQSTHVEYGGRTLVRNNVAYANGGSGIHAYASQHVAILYNTAFANNRAPTDGGQIFANASADVLIRDNILVAQPGGVLSSDVMNASSVVRDGNLYFSPTGPGRFVLPGPHDVWGNPRFVSVANRDYRLRPVSPAIGTGSATDAPPTDIAGTPRPGTAGYDKGAFQTP